MGVSVDFPGGGEIAGVIETIGIAMDGIAADLGIECGEVRVVSTAEFDELVDGILLEIAEERGNDHAPFTSERLGGLVAGKTLARDLTYHDVTVVLNAKAVDWTSNNGQAMGITLAAHELAHVAIGRARHASGVLEGELAPPSQTGTECARSIARIVADEFRADVMANTALGSFVSVMASNGGQRPMTIFDIHGSGHTDRLGEVLASTVHPGWPDTVMSYRVQAIDLGALHQQIVSSTEGVMTLVSHAEAHARAGGEASPISDLANLRGTELYVGPAWQQLAAIFENTHPVPLSLVDVRALEERIASEGTEAILAMWKTLGLTVEEKENREWALWVTDPQR